MTSRGTAPLLKSWRRVAPCLIVEERRCRRATNRIAGRKGDNAAIEKKRGATLALDCGGKKRNRRSNMRFGHRATSRGITVSLLLVDRDRDVLLRLHEMPRLAQYMRRTEETIREDQERHPLVQRLLALVEHGRRLRSLEIVHAHDGFGRERGRPQCRGALQHAPPARTKLRSVVSFPPLCTVLRSGPAGTGTKTNNAVARSIADGMSAEDSELQVHQPRNEFSQHSSSSQTTHHMTKVNRIHMLGSSHAIQKNHATVITKFKTLLAYGPHNSEFMAN